MSYPTATSRTVFGPVPEPDTVAAVSQRNGALSLLDVVSEQQDLAEQVCEKELCAQLRREIAETLDEREARIITLRYGLDGEEPRTQRQTAELCSISRSYVSRLEKGAIGQIKKDIGA